MLYCTCVEVLTPLEVDGDVVSSQELEHLAEVLRCPCLGGAELSTQLGRSELSWGDVVHQKIEYCGNWCCTNLFGLTIPVDSVITR